jgi:hypothetical protein
MFLVLQILSSTLHHSSYQPDETTYNLLHSSTLSAQFLNLHDAKPAQLYLSPSCFLSCSKKVPIDSRNINWKVQTSLPVPNSVTMIVSKRQIKHKCGSKGAYLVFEKKKKEQTLMLVNRLKGLLDH